MSNTFKTIMISAIAIVVCFLLSLTFFITRSGSSDLNENLDQINKIAKQYAGGELQIYNDKVVTGEEVLYAVRHFGLEKVDDRISENPVRVKIDIISSKGTYEASQEVIDILLDRNSPYFVSGTSQYHATLEIKDNIIEKINFSLLENYYANNNELDGYDSAMASTASPTTNTDKVVPGVDSTSIEWGGDGSTEEDGVDKIEDTNVSESEWVYTITGGTAIITKYKGTKVNVTVPEELNGATVVTLARGVFSGNTRLQKVVVPNCVKTIDTEVFKGCSNLLIVKLPSDLETIAPSLFHSCKSLYDVNIPQGVKSIGKAAFHNCVSLGKLAIPNGVSSIGAGAFYGCTSLESLNLSDKVTKIETSTFFNCKALTSIQAEGVNSITSVGDGAFYNCSSLTRFGFDNTSSIGEEAFSNCISLSSVTAGPLKTLGASAFYGCSKLASVDLEEALLTSINKSTFYKCSGLKQITLSKSITSIGAEAFRECKSLGIFDIGANLGEIGAYAFYDCDSLKTLVFNDTLKTIGTGAFGSCDTLGDVYFYASGISGRPVLNGKVFADFGPNTLLHVYHNSTGHKHALKYNIPYVLLDVAEWVYDVTDKGLIITGYLGDKTEVTVPSTIQDAPVIGFGRLEGDPISVFNGKSVTNVTFTNGPQYVGNGAFSGLTTLKSVTLTSSITEIGENAFDGCKELTTVVNTSKVTKIGAYAFSNCVNLEEYNTTDKETYLGKGAFKDCASITSFIMPSKLTAMPAELFSGCSSLSALDFGSVKSIGDKALERCGFTSLTLPTYVTSIGIDAIRGNENLTTLILPAQLTTIGTGAVAQCGITELNIPLTLKSLPAEFATDCMSLKKLNIHANVEKIGSKAFYNCDNLGDIYWYGKTLPKFEAESFVRSDSLTFYVYNKSSAFNYANENNIKYVLLDRISDDWIYSYNDDDKIVLEEYIGADCDLLFIPGNIDGIETVQLGVGTSVFPNSIIKSISVAESITTIGDAAFSGLTSLEQLSINAERYSIGGYAFKDCTKLKSLNLTGATELKVGLFYNCKSLDSLQCNAFTNVPAYLFYNCSSLNLNISNKLITVGQYAFYDAINMANFTFGDSLESIGAKAFSASTSGNTIRTIIYDSTDNNAIIDKSAFDNVVVNVKVYPYSNAEAKFNKDHNLFRFSGAEKINLTYWPISAIELASYPYVMVYTVGAEFVPNGISVNCIFENTTKKTRVWSDVDGYGWTYTAPPTTVGIRDVTVSLVKPKSNPTETFTCVVDGVEWKEYSDYEKYGFEIVEHPADDELSINHQTTSVKVGIKKADGVLVNTQWEYSTDGSVWAQCKEPQNKETVMTISEQYTNLNYKNLFYRACVSTDEVTRYSNVAKITIVPTAPTIATQPSDVTVKKGETAKFKVAVKDCFPTKVQYQWLYNSGSGYANCGEGSATTDTLSIVTSQHNGMYVKCAVSNIGGTVESRAALLTMYYTFTVTKPANKTVYAGQGASFSVTASGGNPNTYTYQWYWRDNSSASWYAQSGKTSATYNLGGCYKDWSGGQVYCKVSNGQYTVDSEVATLTVNNSITLSAVNNNSLVGGNATTALCYSKVTVAASSAYEAVESWSASGSGTASSDGNVGYITGNSTYDSTATLSCKGVYGSTASITITFKSFNMVSISPTYGDYVNMGDTLTISTNAVSAKVKVIDWISAQELDQATAGASITKKADSGTVLTGSTVSYTMRKLGDNVVASNTSLNSGGTLTIQLINPYNANNVGTFTYSVVKTQYRVLTYYNNTSDYTAGPLHYAGVSYDAAGYGGGKDTKYFNFYNSNYYLYLYSAGSNIGYSGSGVAKASWTGSSGKSGYGGTIYRYQATRTGTAYLSLAYNNLNGKTITCTVAVKK